VYRYLNSVRSTSRDYLKQFSVTRRTEIEAQPVLPFEGSKRMHHRMPDVSGLNPMLQGRRMKLPHPFHPKAHATSRTSKLGMAMAPAPAIRARMRVT